MCLNGIKRIYPETDITVYKVFRVCKLGEPGMYCSPYYRFNWVTNKVYETGKNEPVIFASGAYGDCFHSFDTEDSAEECAVYFKSSPTRVLITPSWKNDKYVVKKCLIPKDSKFVYEGTYDYHKCYASEKLIVL